MAIWPNFLSPLLWDVFAVSTYATVSVLFWYMGMVPDLATFRDRAKSKIAYYAYGIFSLGWRGSNRHWHVYERAYLILAALATPLVLSVHSVVSFDFAVSQLPGWHTTIFPPYFVTGAIFSGFAMVVTLAVPARELFGLKNFITLRHIDNMAKIILLTSCIVGYAYSTEFFMAWYGGNSWEQFHFHNRLHGADVVGRLDDAHLQRHRAPRALVQAGPHQRLGLVRGQPADQRGHVVRALRDHRRRPARAISCRRAGAPTAPSYVEVLTLMGSFGLFLTLFLLFCRYLPMVAMAEVKGILPSAQPEDEDKETRRQGDMESRRKFRLRPSVS